MANASISRRLHWFCAPATLAKIDQLESSKGAIAVGLDAFVKC